MYTNKNPELAAQKIASIKDVVYQACGYDLDNPSADPLVLNREAKPNGCEADYQRYNTAYIEYLKAGKESQAEQLKQVLDMVNKNGGCSETDKTI